MNTNRKPIAAACGILAAALVAASVLVNLLPAAEPAKPLNQEPQVRALMDAAFLTGAQTGYTIGANFGTKQDVDDAYRAFTNRDVAAYTAVMDRVMGRNTFTNTPAKNP